MFMTIPNVVEDARSTEIRYFLSLILLAVSSALDSQQIIGKNAAHSHSM